MRTFNKWGVFKDQKRYLVKKITKVLLRWWESETLIKTLNNRTTTKSNQIILWLLFNSSRSYHNKLSNLWTKTVSSDQNLKSKEFNWINLRKNWIKRDNSLKKWALFKKISHKSRSKARMKSNRIKMKSGILSWLTNSIRSP
jgi:hypothetical protein